MGEFHGRHNDPPLSVLRVRSGDPLARDVASRYDAVDGDVAFQYGAVDGDGAFHDAHGEALHDDIGGGVPRDIHGVALVGGAGALQNDLRCRPGV